MPASMGLTRGKGCSPDKPVPYEHDGSDAAAMIDWISRQTWSDGRVGMYGGSYEGFTQWAAAKHMPKALKALMPSVTVAPGIDVPMEGNVFQTFVYYWPFYTDDEQDSRRRALQRPGALVADEPRVVCHRSGLPRSGQDRRHAQPVLRPLARPSELRLVLAGHDPLPEGVCPHRHPGPDHDRLLRRRQIGALYYFSQHHEYLPGAEHYLLIGPYDHVRGQRGTFGRLGNPLTVLQGYETDPVAQIDLGELRYQWFDYVFKGGAKPPILKDKVNYEVMGANEWQHAPSLAAMGNQTLRFHLSAEKTGDYLPAQRTEARGQSLRPAEVDLADRTDIDRVFPGGGIVDKELNHWNGIVFVSDPFRKPTELSGLFSGRLDFIANKKDLDFASSSTS